MVNQHFPLVGPDTGSGGGGRGSSRWGSNVGVEIDHARNGIALVVLK